MAEIYKYCDGSTLKQVSVTFDDGVCTYDSNYDDGGFNHTVYKRELEFTFNSGATRNIVIGYTYRLRVIEFGVGVVSDSYYTGYRTMLSGETTLLYETDCQHEYVDTGVGERSPEERDGGEDDFDAYSRTYYYDEFELIPQDTIPVCAAPPVECAMELLSVDTTDNIVRGGETGEIAVTISGITSGYTVSYKLNGVEAITGTTALTAHTFTGLTAGLYQVYIEDTYGCFVYQDDITILDGEFRTGDFIVNSPTGLTCTDSPVIVRVQTAINNPNSSPNITTFTIADDLSNGDSIEFNLTSPFVYNQIFYSKNFPNKPNFFLSSVLSNQNGVAVGANTNTEIATSLAEALQNDAVIPKVYYINNSGTTVTLQAKETGTKYSLDSSNAISSTTGITVTQTQAPTDYCDGQILDNYSVSCEVMVNTDTTNQYPEEGDATDYNRVAELILPFNQATNSHKFDISGILKTQVSTPVPNMNLTGSTYLPTVMQPWFVKLSELYPLVANTNTVKKRYKTNTDVQWSINSSLDRYVANDMSDYIGTERKFLTNSPNPKQIQRNGSEFLYFVLEKNYGKQLDVRGDLYFYDGTSETGQTFFVISTGLTNAGGCMCMNLSYDKLGLAAYENYSGGTRKIKRAEIAVYASGGTIQYSETKIYRFEIDEMPRKYSVLFQNALGMYDAFDFIGVVEDSVDRESGNYTVPLNYNNDGSLNNAFKNNATYNTRIIKTITVNTGWVDSAHMQWLLELIKSNNIYNSDTGNQNYLNLVGNPDWKTSSLDDLFSAEFTFEWTLYENNITV